MDTKELIDYISNSKKQTPVEVYIKGNLKDIKFDRPVNDGSGDFLYNFTIDMERVV